MTGLNSRPGKLLWAQTAIVAAIVAAVPACAGLLGPRQHFIGVLAVCYGFVLGWFAGWLGKRWQIRPEWVDSGCAGIRVIPSLLRLLRALNAVFSEKTSS